VSPVESLRAAVLADPEALEPRLVYADALTAAGDPRGAFIAGQCRLASLDPLDPEYPALVAETERLRATHAAQWLAPALDLLGVAEADRTAHARAWVFERGFASRVTLDIEVAAAAAAALAGIEPIDGLTLHIYESVPDAQRSFPEVRGWRWLGLEVEGWFTDYSLAHTLGWGLDRVTRLSLAKCAIGLGGSQLLANLPTDLGASFDDYVAPPPLPEAQLRRLDLRGCAIGDAGLEVLAPAATLAALESLDLTQNRLGTAALAHLRTLACAGSLRELSLAGNNDLGPDLDQLAGWAPLAQLRRLALPQSTTAQAFAALFRQPSASLRELALTANKTLGPRPDLVGGCAQQLTSLELGTAKVGDAGLTQLLAAPSVASLTRLELNGCSVSDKGVAALVGSGLVGLNHLDLSSNKLTDASLVWLADWPGIRHLVWLRLGNNRKLSAAGYQALVDSAYFEPAQLRVGKVADVGARQLLHDRFGDRVIFD
jgi:uncharacterized protein (TIGR02996 family)